MSEFIQALIDAFFTWENLGEILAIVFGIALLYVSKKYLKFFKEVTEAIQTYVNAKKETSDGGKKITKAERADIADEVMDSIRELLNMFSGGIFGKIMGFGKMIKNKISRK